MALDIEREIRELFADKMREFIKFCGEHWTMSEKDFAQFQSGRSEDYRQGYNAGMTDGVAAALSYWLEEEF